MQKVYRKKMSLNQAMQEFERRLLQVVMERNGGNRTVTAADMASAIVEQFLEAVKT